jgi:acetyl esterase
MTMQYDLIDPSLDDYLAETRELNARVLPMMTATRLDLSTPDAVAHTRATAGAAYGMRDAPDVGAVGRRVVSSCGAVDVRLIAPEGTPRGVYLDIHGGGFFMGTAAMGDVRNARLARDLGLAVVSVDYRLAPEEPYPAAIDDCEAAAAWLLEAGEAEFGCRTFFVGGGSAGATLAAQVALRVRERHQAAERIGGVNLFYGIYDFAGTPSARRREAPWRAVYLPGRSGDALRDPDVSPLYARLDGYPDTLVSVGTLDPLLDDSLFFAARLAAAGTSVDLAVYPESLHGFDSFPTKMAAAAHRRVHEFIRTRLPA